MRDCVETHSSDCSSNLSALQMYSHRSLAGKIVVRREGRQCGWPTILTFKKLMLRRTSKSNFAPNNFEFSAPGSQDVIC